MINQRKIEDKWQKKWQEDHLYDFKPNDKPKLFCLEMFSYPSGAKLHLGHWYNYGVCDTWARFKRMTGYNVFQPMGFDAFGLPAENYAIKTGVHPRISTENNIATMEKQLQKMGSSIDWNYEVVTCREDYYKGTQWLFLQLYKHGLAYKKEAPVNWCPSCNTVLANEQVIAGVCERCGSTVTHKNMNQWFFKITQYAEELLQDLDKIDWPEKTKTLQRNWIGKSNGAYVDFKVADSKETFKVFTTRADTLFGATYCVLAPEHEIVNKITTAEQKKAVLAYQEEAAKQSEIERTSTVKEKTGVFTGAYAINPVNNEKIPIWISDYVLASYGTGAIMAVPAHDERDYEFAKKFNIPIKPVVAPVFIGDDKPVKGKKDTKRNVVVLIVKHPEKEEYLCVKNNKFNWQSLVMGGIEEGEDGLTAAKRELAEETGYVDIEEITKQPYAFIEQFYAAHKDVNRHIMNNVFLVKLKSLKSVDVTEEEKNTQTPIWVKKEDLINTLTFSTHKNLSEIILENNCVYTGEGLHINSEFLDGLNKEEALNKMYDWLEKNHCGKKTTTYKLRDWLVSRQRYWGAPIPIVYCDDCGMVPVDEKDLPVVLPDNVEFAPNGESPLKKCSEFVNTTCPKCGKKAKREVDTLDTFVCSSWYYLRYPDNKNTEQAFDPKIINEMLPVDKYIGGVEHACMHLLYARFITKALRDMGYLNFSEPFKSLVHQGLILGPDGEKMSKSKGNTVSPDDYVEKYGADVLRGYLMFGFNYVEGGPWADDGIKSINKFYQKVERLTNSISEDKTTYPDVDKVLNKTIKSIYEDIEKFQFNTCMARIMEYSNALTKIENAGIPRYYIEQLLLILAPFAPHLTEELWSQIGNSYSIHNQDYPKYDASKIKEDSIVIGVQINGKLRSEVTVSDNDNEQTVKEKVLKLENVNKYVMDKQIVKFIYVPKKIVNIVIK